MLLLTFKTLQNAHSENYKVGVYMIIAVNVG